MLLLLLFTDEGKTEAVRGGMACPESRPWSGGIWIRLSSSVLPTTGLFYLPETHQPPPSAHPKVTGPATSEYGPFSHAAPQHIPHRGGWRVWQ